MRLRFWVVSMTALLTATAAMAGTGYPPRTGGNYNGARWYGYYANNNSFDSLVPQNFDHTNITEIWATYPGETRTQQLSDATTAITDNLKVAAEYGEKAMVDIGAIVFIPTGSNSSICYQNNPTAAADFQNLVQALINGGYLIPNSPELSTVSSFYVADEPDGNCLADLGGTGMHTPNPALLNAISAIRQNADTTNFPLAAIVTYNNYTDMSTGLGLFDWVGLDDYQDVVTDYLGHFGSFEDFAKAYDVVGGTPQHFFLVPLVSPGVGDTYTNGAPYMQSKFLADNNVIGIMPFQWQGMDGTSWASSYIALGESIVFPSSVATTVIVDYLTTQ